MREERAELAGMVDAGVDAALDWRRRQPEWVGPVEELRGCVEAALSALVDGGLVVVARESGAEGA